MSVESVASIDARGRVAVFDHEGTSLLGIVTGVKKEKYLLFSERSREVELIPARLQFLKPFKSASAANTVAERQNAMQELRQRAELLELPLPMFELWELTGSNEREYELSELCELLFSTPTAVEEFSVRLKLVTDKVYFKRNQSLFTPRPAAVVTELLSAERTRLEGERAKVDFIALVAARVKNSLPPDPLEERFTNFLKLLKRTAGVAALGPNEHKDAQQLVNDIVSAAALPSQPHLARAALQVLRAGNLVPGNFNPVLERSELRKQFSKETYSAAEALEALTRTADFQQKLLHNRVDLRELEVVTVDDASTKDIDDGLSYERLPDGNYRIGIHITDVGSIVQLNSPLAIEAAVRGTSVYLPETKLHMFPKILSQGALSLNPGEERPAISCFLIVNAAGEILSTKVERTRIISKAKITYDELDRKLLDKTSPYTTLYDFCVEQEKIRLKNGAFRVTKPELFVDVSETGQVSLYTFDEHSPARHMIAELAILANHSFAAFASSANIPYIFRTQADPAPAPQLEELEDGPAKHFLFRIKLPRSFTGIKPLPHSGLGLKCYGQATSPIRRYADLINQWQIGAYLDDKAKLLSPPRVEEAIKDLETPLSRSQSATKESRRYWLLRYIEQKGTKSLSGTVVRVDGKIPLIELDEVSFVNAFRSKQKVFLGQKLIVTVKELNSLDDMLKLDA